MEILKRKPVDVFFNKLTVIFKYAFLTLALVSFNSLLANHPMLTFFSTGVAIIGVIIVFYRLLNANRYIRFFGFIVLVAFLVSYFVSSLISAQYGIIENIQALAWMTFHVGVCYVADAAEDETKAKKTYIGLLAYFSVYVALANIVSIAMLLVGYGKSPIESFNGNIIGFVWGRLWGMYADPNYGAVFCVAAVIISCYFFGRTAKAWLKMLLSFNILLSFSYIAFSDSRTGLVCLLVTLFFCVLFVSKARVDARTEPFLKRVLCLGFAIAVVFVGFFSLKTIKETYNTVVILASEHKTDPGGETSPSLSENDLPSAPSVIDREGNELQEDISNRRFDLWKSGIEVWSHSPIFGVSHRNIVPFSLDKVPDTYLVNNDRIGNFNTTHNAYIDILVSQGTVGAILFLLFFVAIIVLIFKKMMFSKGSENCTPENILSVGLIIAFAASACFVLEVVYINTAGAILFWTSLGMLVKNLGK